MSKPSNIINYSIADIAAMLRIRFAETAALPVKHLLIDSRKLYFPESSLFFALKSARNDGHKFIPALYSAGVRSFIVSENIETNLYPGTVFLKVENTVDALQTVAAYHRHQFNLPIIGITGSNGKTMVKEILYQLLHHDYIIARSPKSYNSQIGVPLSTWELNDTHTMGVFEAGISRPGEMQKLQRIIDPSIGIFTFIGDAHAEGFSSVREKIEEKLLLFKEAKVLVYCADETALADPFLKFKRSQNPSLKLFSWGYALENNVRLLSVIKGETSSNIMVQAEDVQCSFIIPFTDDASIHNCLTCFSVLILLNFHHDQIALLMMNLVQVEMRLELKQGINNCSIINDSYSSDINSFMIALDFLQQQQQHVKRTVILSDILQTGQEPSGLYRVVASIIKDKYLYRFIGIGEQLSAHAHLFEDLPQKSFYHTTDDFIASLASIGIKDETILLKGARFYEFERISAALEQKTHQTLLEIDLSAIRINLDVYRDKLSPGVKLMGMVKAFSYGSGSFEIANLLQYAGVDFLAVAYADEGVALRQAGIKLPIMVMNVDDVSFETLVQYSLQPELYSFKVFNDFRQFLRERRLASYPAHIKLDTGMHRLGFEPGEIDALCAELEMQDDFSIISVFSHLVGSDDAMHDEFTIAQASLFNEMVLKLQKSVSGKFIRHLANTSAISRMPALQLDMVRLGIGLYGIDANPRVQAKLKTVATLKTTIAQIKHVKKGESVGYSRKGIVQRDSIIATVRIGYADGYRRDFGNGVGKMLLNGKYAPVIGNICMDMTMLDITDVEAQEEDEVIVFGEGLPVTELARWSDSIAYEMLTGISQRVKRVYYES